MNDYRTMLIQRAKKAAEATPASPDKPLSFTQYKNKLNVMTWRERHQEWLMTKSWLS